MHIYHVAWRLPVVNVLCACMFIYLQDVHVRISLSLRECTFEDHVYVHAIDPSMRRLATHTRHTSGCAGNEPASAA